MTRTEAKWVERIREWKSSGQTADEFAQGQDFQPSTMRWWASRIARGAVGKAAAKPPPTSRVRMVRVVATRSEGSPLTVRVGAAQIEVRAGFDHGLLRELVATLGGEL